MKNVNFFLIITTLLLMSLCGCNRSSKISGMVINPIDGKTISKATIIATTTTNIREDKKYEKSTATTNSQGEFLLKGLSKKYKYTLTVKKDGYSSYSLSRVGVPEKGQTKMLDKPFKIIKEPSDIGVYFVSNNQLNKISPKRFIQENYRYCSNTFSYGGEKKFPFEFIKKENLTDVVKIENNRLQSQYLIVWTDIFEKFTKIEPLTYFAKLESCVNDGYRAKDRKSQWDVSYNDIYVAGHISSIKNRITGTVLYDYRNSFGQRNGNFTYQRWTLDTENLEHSTSYGDLYLINLNSFSKGLYALEAVEDNLIRWVFEIE